jgi:hypothetical protein
MWASPFSRVASYHSLVFEANLADCHTAILFKIGPRCVDDRDVILLVTLEMYVSLRTAAERKRLAYLR